MDGMVAYILLQQLLETVNMGENKPKEYFEFPLSVFSQYTNTTKKSCYYTVRHGICELHLGINCVEPNTSPILVYDKLPLIPETRYFYINNRHHESTVLEIHIVPDRENNCSKLYVGGGTAGAYFYEDTILYFVE